MKKVIDSFSSNILGQIKQEIKRVQKEFAFARKIKAIKYKENSIIFEAALKFILDPSKTLQISIASDRDDIIFKEGNLIWKESKEEVTNLFNKDIFLKNNILSLSNPNVVIDMKLLKGIAVDQQVFDVFMDFMNKYSIILNRYNKLQEQLGFLDDYIFKLKKNALGGSTFIDKIDKNELKIMISDHNKEYTKFVKDFNIFGTPYKLLINL